MAGDRLVVPEQWGVRRWPTGVCAPCIAVRPPGTSLLLSWPPWGPSGETIVHLCPSQCHYSDKTSRITCSEKYHSEMLELLGTQSNSEIFSVNGSDAPEAPCWLQSDIFLHVRMRSHCQEKLQHKHRTEEESPLWSISWHKSSPKEKQDSYWLPLVLLVFVPVSAKSLQDGIRRMGEEGSNLASPEARRKAQNSRVGIRCGNSAEQIN